MNDIKTNNRNEEVIDCGCDDSTSSFHNKSSYNDNNHCRNEIVSNNNKKNDDDADESSSSSSSSNHGNKRPNRIHRQTTIFSSALYNDDDDFYYDSTDDELEDYFNHGTDNEEEEDDADNDTNNKKNNNNNNNNSSNGSGMILFRTSGRKGSNNSLISLGKITTNKDDNGGIRNRRGSNGSSNHRRGSMNSSNNINNNTILNPNTINHNPNNNNNNNNDTDSLLLEEFTTKTTTNAVYHAKVVVISVVIISLIGAIVIYVYTRKSEQTVFYNQYNDDAAKVLGSLLSAMERTLGAFDSLATNFITIANQTNQTFPFVTIPNYAAHIAKTIQLTGSIVTTYAPIVPFEQRIAWEQFASGFNSNLWNVMNETIRFQRQFTQYPGLFPEQYNWTFRDILYDDDYSHIPYNNYQPNRYNISIPEWQIFPLNMNTYAPANYDWYSMYDSQIITASMQTRQAVLVPPVLIDKPDDPEVSFENRQWCDFLSDFLPRNEECFEPLAVWMYPILDHIDTIEVTKSDDYPDKFDIKGYIISNVYWRHLLQNILPRSSTGIVIVFENSYRGDKFTYEINGPDTKYLGSGDHHNTKYNPMVITTDMFNLDIFRTEQSSYFGLPVYNVNNTYTLYVYPSDDLQAKYVTNKPIIFAVSAAAFVIVPFLVFLLYDRMVSRQQNEILLSAKRSNAIVSSLFPSHIRAQLYPQIVVGGKNNTSINTQTNNNNSNNAINNNNSDKNLGLNKSSTHSESQIYISTAPPIAQLYPETTVLFADIVSFTSWSSVRDPLQVFTLLETIYNAFDDIANKRKVFKVETIGDSYVAVTGLPTPRRDHACCMARFARDIIRVMTKVASQLGTRLGPGTSSLQIRVGINSGPTTAGVLRGAKGRFQLFGDTVNTAARMESNSKPGRIMCSEKTADSLRSFGKDTWLTPRNGLIDAKGKGMMQCYWVNPKSSKSMSMSMICSSHPHSKLFPSDDGSVKIEAPYTQEVIWIAELLEGMLRNVVANRAASGQVRLERMHSLKLFGESATTPRDEVTETIILPSSSGRRRESTASNSKTGSLNSEIKFQIQDYVTSIAALYHSNPFHNFNHACHVVMTTKKLLNRVTKPTGCSISATAYGITSDPLTQFAIVFSALIHDVQHPGVSNAQLVKEQSDVAIRFHNKSVAEQNSVTVAWDLLMQPEFTDFREAIMADDADYKRFRQLIVNSVMATDLFDSDLRQLRENRWAKAFADDTKALSPCETDEDCNRRATIVIEHIIQASDVSHTMQHWHVYQEWNRRLFNEMYSAYASGRAEKDPSVGWYDGELWFFDNYIIPLAKKLKTCGVFGVSCDELLDYATDNRAEWATKGCSIVEENLRLIQSASMTFVPSQDATETSWTENIEG